MPLPSTSRISRTAFALVASLAIAAAAACGDKPNPAGSTGSTGSGGPARPGAVAPHAHYNPPERTGGALMRSADGSRLYLADEDHKSLRVLPLPFLAAPEGGGADASPSASAAPSASAPKPSASAYASASAKPREPPPKPGTIPPVEPPPNATQTEVPMPGAPAQVMALDGYVLATIRDPGLLIVMKESAAGELTEERRIPLPADAWGIALSPDEKIAIVTSAWTHKVTGVEWATGKVLWTLDVDREPRAVVIHPDGNAAYVSHLTSANLTKIEGIAGASAKATKIAFPAAPNRAPQGITLEGTLGYAMVIDDAGNRLLAARHALGGLALDTWFGVSTIDVLQTKNDKPLLAPRVPDKRVKSTPAFEKARADVLTNFADQPYRVRPFTGPDLSTSRMIQPRAMVVARKSKLVWVASEGSDMVEAFPLMAAAPAEQPDRSVSVGDKYKDPKIIGNGYSYNDGIAGHCGAPTGLAMSADESQLFVFCRSTYDVAAIRLVRDEKSNLSAVSIARVATDPLDESVSRGRRLFYGARDSYSSGGMGCAGCHPEGRDDGHVWHEVEDVEEKRTNFLAHQNLALKTHEGKLGYPRQTPMLAGRVSASGPYGWHAQAADLVERLADGFNLHRWGRGDADAKSWMTGERANALGAFLRKGVVPPPGIGRELSDVEKEGKKIFESDATQCTVCHVASSEFTNRAPAKLPKLPTVAGFEDEADDKFKTPSLFFVSGSAPYFHDGSVSTLSELIAKNGDRMGKTSQLTQPEKDALVAYLETL